MDKKIEALKTFLDASHSVYHAAKNIADVLENAGYTRLYETDKWELSAGGKYYLVRGGTAVLAFRIPEGTPTGFMMTASHSDRPTFKVKENGVLEGKYTRLATEKYGGMLMAPWLDRPLSIAGRVMVQTEKGLESRLVDIDRDLLLIPNVAIHMNRDVNDEKAWNPAVDTIPLLGSGHTVGSMQKILEEEAGGKVLGHDLWLYLRQKPSVWGVEGEYLSAQGLDDLSCAWCSTMGFLEAGESEAIPVLCVFDNEEIGSATFQGADSEFLAGVLTRICKSRGLRLEAMLAQSFMISADNGHAVHPNHPEYADPGNGPMLNEGVVLKFQAGKKYTTDGLSAAVFRKICAKADVPVQTFYNRGDMKGGSTLGNISLSHVSVLSVDMGIAQLAMHSAYETVGVKDVEYLHRMFANYFSHSMHTPAVGCYNIK